MKTNQKHSDIHHYTLIELLTTLSIICILMALLIPTLAQVAESANSKTCINRQRQLIEASLLFIGDNNGTMPGKPIDWMKESQLGYYVGNSRSGWFTAENEVFFCPSAGEIAIAKFPSGTHHSGGIAINGAVTGYGSRPEKQAQIQTAPSIWPLFTDGICQRWVGWGTMESFDDLDPNVTWGTHEASYWSFAFRYSKRHNNNANVGFFDGHVGTFTDLYEAQQEGELKYAWR